MPTPKTIITYLVDGNPQGIKTVELSNWNGKALSIPRASLKEAKNRPETNQPALYFLFGEDENENKMAYIGEAENVIQRMADHDSKKEFWDTVVAFISTSNSLTKADVKYLEARAVDRAKKANRYILQNSTAPIPNNLPEFQQSAMEEFLQNVDLLISAMGYPILKEIEKAKIEKENMYYLNSRGSDAKGVYMEDGFLVLKGSSGPKEMVKSTIENERMAFRHRPILLEKGIIKEEGENIIFLSDYLFTSPSSASDIIVGRDTNGWIVWKDKDGKTLDENERKNLTS
ncbi:hypothetical protein P148_SR1C00001G0888 [candidate division SR1 bacterium RAAC1_SR1_1]|nr:hypothetical protein P148_SR1C00001G0888 [candidate division SR1 bacterium RAAC1_SR1_1]